jgi:glutaredoxin
MIWNLIRWPLGQLILLVDFITSPRPPSRDPALQARIDAATADLAMYQFKACPFCVKTRRAMRRLGVNIELRDARHNPQWRAQLLAEGGKLQVPCLLISNGSGTPQWLYESDAIIAHLEQLTASAEQTQAA